MPHFLQFVGDLRAGSPLHRQRLKDAVFGDELNLDAPVPPSAGGVEKLVALPGLCPDAPWQEGVLVVEMSPPIVVECEVLPDVSPMGESVGMPFDRGEEEQPSRFYRPGRDDDHLGTMLLFRRRIVALIDEGPRSSGPIQDQPSDGGVDVDPATPRLDGPHEVMRRGVTNSDRAHRTRSEVLTSGSLV